MGCVNSAGPADSAYAGLSSDRKIMILFGPPVRHLSLFFFRVCVPCVFGVLIHVRSSFGKGAGKGTHGPKIEQALDIPALSTGDMLR